MNRLHFSAAIACQAFVCTSMWAQSPTWPNEVTSLRGVDLGTQITDVPECPKRTDAVLRRTDYWPNYRDDYPGEFKDRVCWMTTQDPPLIKSAKAVKLSNLPFIKGAGQEAMATIVDGSIEALDVRILSEYAATFREAMVEKYGKPSKQTVRQFQNRLGAQFEGASLLWYGRRVTLTFDEVNGSTEWGLISMRTRTFDAALSSQAGDAKSPVKSGL